MPFFPSGEQVKLSAAWLIDRAGLKGISMGNAATHEKQPLVLVNRGKAEGKEIADLARFIREKINARFGVELEMEVLIL